MNHQFLEDLRQKAEVVMTWDFCKVLGNTIDERFVSLDDNIKALGLVFAVKYEVVPTMLIGGLETMSLLETSEKFVVDFQEITDTVRKVGTHRGMDVYKDSWFAANCLLVSDGKNALAMEVKGLI